MKTINWKVLIGSLIAVLATALVGSFFTSSRVNTDWYQSIKPALTPPNYVFPIVWNILFLMIAFSLYFAWISSSQKDKSKIKFVFGLNFTLNVMWSFFYFYLMNPLAGFFVLMALWLSIALLMINVARVSNISNYLLIPYLIWVSFAGILNFLSI
jgi:benzodiazapine receptor